MLGQGLAWQQRTATVLSLSLSLSFSKPMYVCGADCVFQKLHTSGPGAKVSWVVMGHRNKMNKQQTTSYLQKALSCTRSVESSVSNVGQADPRQAQGCIKGSLPTSRQIQHSRAWTGRRPKKMVVSWYLFVVQWWFYLFIGVCTTILLVFPWDSRNKQFSWLLSCTLLDGLAKTYIKSKNT